MSESELAGSELEWDEVAEDKQAGGTKDKPAGGTEDEPAAGIGRIKEWWIMMNITLVPVLALH